MSFMGDNGSCSVGSNPLRKALNVGGPLEVFPGRIHASEGLQGPSGRLEAEFADFRARNGAVEMVPVPQALQMSHTNQVPYHASNEANSWVREFNQMNLGPKPQQYPNYTPMARQANGMHAHAMPMHTHAVQTIQPTPAPLGFMGTLQNTLSNSMKSITELQAFDAAFGEVEKELEEDPIEEDRSSFANVAQSVFNIMNGAPQGKTADKFKKSRFMDLMQRISTREVEIEGEAFVTRATPAVPAPTAIPAIPVRAEHEISQPGAFAGAVQFSAQYGVQVKTSEWEGEFA